MPESGSRRWRGTLVGVVFLGEGAAMFDGVLHAELRPATIARLIVPRAIAVRPRAVHDLLLREADKLARGHEVRRCKHLCRREGPAGPTDSL